MMDQDKSILRGNFKNLDGHNGISKVHYLQLKFEKVHVQSMDITLKQIELNSFVNKFTNSNESSIKTENQNKQFFKPNTIKRAFFPMYMIIYSR